MRRTRVQNVANAGPAIIKRYANRRLYDTSGSRYINLEDIAALVRNGKEVKIVDAKTGEDLTRVTLTQIIVEDAREQPTGLPLELLRQMIVASDKMGRDFIMWYLKSAFDAYHKVQSALQSGLSEVQAAAFSPLQAMKNLVGGEAPAPAISEVEELRKRVADLEAGLAKTGTRRRAPRGKSAGERKQR